MGESFLSDARRVCCASDSWASVVGSTVDKCEARRSKTGACALCTVGNSIVKVSSATTGSTLSTDAEPFNVGLRSVDCGEVGR
jgi:hypothetical protein